MSDTGDYIYREAAIENICGRLKMTHPGGIEYSNADVRAFVAALISPIPAADVRHVVLCRDCKYSYDSVGGWCCSHGICVDCIVREDFFCADGEKREES